jgi:regulator of protease activity HflC (stomatin/prohibitin superfamily)
MGITLGFILGLICIGFLSWFVVAISSKKHMQTTVSSILGIISIIVFIVVPFSFRQINTGEIAVVKKWGKAEYTKTEGTHFDFWLGKKYEKYDIKVRQLESQTMAYSQDAQTMNLQITIQYRIQADKALEINREFGDLALLESRIKSIIEDRTKSTMSSMQAMKIIESRNTLSSQVLANISEVSDRYYVEIINVLITNIDFSDAFEQAVENKMISEQQQLQAEYEAKKAETEAKGKLEVAKLEAEAQLEKAKKDAEAIEVKAEAEANALKIIQDAWNEIPEDVKQVMLQEMAIDKWSGDLPTTMVGDDFIKWLMGAIGSGETTA